jgi:metalloendopeptidase OMA1, mitochondrial
VLRFARRGVSLLLVVLWGAGCEQPGPQGGGEGPGRRQQQLALSPKQELELGRRAFQEVLKEYRGRILPEDDPQTVKVRRVVGRITKAAEIEPLQREINLNVRGYRFEWEVRVVRDKQANAFCLPAGKIVVFTGILPVAKTEGQLATVLAHEIAHALAHHSSERLAAEKAQGGGVLRKLSFNRAQELEADHIGVFLMTFAGYDPDEAVTFWKRMQQATGEGQRPEILSDHPSDAHRIQQLSGWVPWARAAKKAYDAGNVLPAGGRQEERRRGVRFRP